MQARLAVDHNLTVPDAKERSALQDALRFLHDLPDGMVQLDVPRGANVPLPTSAVQAIRHVIDRVDGAREAGLLDTDDNDDVTSAAAEATYARVITLREAIFTILRAVA